MNNSVSHGPLHCDTPQKTVLHEQSDPNCGALLPVLLQIIRYSVQQSVDNNTDSFL